MFICAGYFHRQNTAGGRAVAMETANLSKILDKITFYRDHYLVIHTRKDRRKIM